MINSILEDEPCPWELLGPSQSQIPYATIVDAEILGSDNKSYIYIALVINKEIEETYHEMYGKMEGRAAEDNCISQQILQKGLHCILKLEKPSVLKGGIYVRGKVLEMDLTNDVVKCLVIDEHREVELHPSQIYRTTQDVLKYELFTIKCQLADMHCFLGHPFLKDCYEEHLKTMRTSRLGICKVKIEERPRHIPMVRIGFPKEDLPFSSTLQQYLPIIGKMQYPTASVVTKVKITHATTNGMICFQNWDGQQLFQVIEDILINFDPQRWIQTTVPAEDSYCWKTEYLSGSKAISIYKAADIRKCYRVEAKEVLEDGDMLVSFIDFGYEKVVNSSDLYSAPLIDQTLCFIPPQCLPVVFTGKKEKDSFDVDQFWDCFPDKQTQAFICLKDYGGININKAFRGLVIPEAEVIVQTPEESVFLLRQSCQREGAFEMLQEEKLTGLLRKKGEQIEASSSPKPRAIASITKLERRRRRRRRRSVSRPAVDMLWIVNRLRSQFKSLGLFSDPSSKDGTL